MMKRDHVRTTKAEYLATSPARDDVRNKPVVVIAVRMDPTNRFRPTNIVLSKAAAQRLVKELQAALLSPMMLPE